VTVGENVEENEMLIDLLIPIVKTNPSEIGILATSAAIQVFGGYGYCGVISMTMSSQRLTVWRSGSGLMKKLP